jgi:hypothetical protein
VENVKAEALGRNGKVLRSTGVVRSEVEVLRFRENVGKGDRKIDDDWGSWLQKGLGFFRNQEL